MTRRAKLRWTGGLLTAGAVLGTAGFLVWRTHRPRAYHPGEDDAEITDTLSRALPKEAPQPKLTDVTASAGLSEFRTFAGERTSQLPEDMGGGAAWGDYDNDGYDDLFLVSNGGPLDAPAEKRAASLLYRNLGDGTFRKVQDFPETRIIGMGAAWGDYDNDGWLDLVVTGYNTILLFRNDHGHFVRVANFPSPPGFWTGASWGDYDHDGRLDLYVCGYVKYLAPRFEDRTRASAQFGLEVPYTLNPSSYKPERNLAFHNNGDGTFTEVGEKLGVSDPQGRSLSALWHDLDQDGWIDLYVANDISENKLYLNRHGKFVDAGQSAWIAEYRGSMGLAAGDWDRDGDDDLFISHWIAQQFALYGSLLADNRKLRPGVPPELHFMDTAEVHGVGQPTLQAIGWGAEFVDLDNDGWLDLPVAAGSTFETKETPPRLRPMPSFLFWNRQGKHFHDLAPRNASLATPHVSRGLAVADYDNNGSMDIALVDHDGGVRLLRNDMAQGNWAEFRLRGRTLPFGDGAVLVASAGGIEFRRTVSSASYLSQSSRRIHVGLGKLARIDRVLVFWAGGNQQSWTGLDSNRIWELNEGEPEPHTPAGARTGPGKQDIVAFWEKERSAMAAIKVERNVPKAIALFREALALNPVHEDSLYYLANCLAAQGDLKGAMAELERLVQVNPQSQRGLSRWGVLRAETASSPAEWKAAEGALERVLALNPEETGTLIVLGELALIQRRPQVARQRLEWACRTNPRAAGALFLRAYLATKDGDTAGARQLLVVARHARGPDWKPKGTAAEGEVQKRTHTEGTLLSRFWEDWDGAPDLQRVFAGLDLWLKGHERRASNH